MADQKAAIVDDDGVDLDDAGMPYLVPKSPYLPTPVVRAGAGLHRYHARWLRLQER